MRCTSCYLLVAALLLAALLFGNPLPRRAAVVQASGVAPAVAAATVPECPDPELAPAVVRHEVRAGRSIWWLQDGSAVVVRDGRAQRVPAGADPLVPAAGEADPATAAVATPKAVPAPAVHAAAAAEPGHDPR